MLFFFKIYQHFAINQFFVTIAIIFCVYMFTDLLKHLHFFTRDCLCFLILHLLVSLSIYAPYPHQPRATRNALASLKSPSRPFPPPLVRRLLDEHHAILSVPCRSERFFSTPFNTGHKVTQGGRRHAKCQEMPETAILLQRGSNPGQQISKRNLRGRDPEPCMFSSPLASVTMEDLVHGKRACERARKRRPHLVAKNGHGDVAEMSKQNLNKQVLATKPLSHSIVLAS